MKTKLLLKVFLLLTLISTLFIPSAFATWNYAVEQTPTIHNDINTALVEFIYKPEEVLPGHEVGYLGTNHQEVIENVANLTKYGLNSKDKKSLLNYLEDLGGIVYSNHPGITGGNLKFVGDESGQLMWAVVQDSETQCSIYTFSKEKINGSYKNQTVTVYKTICLYQNDKWENVRAYTGESIVIQTLGIYTIDVKGWYATMV